MNNRDLLDCAKPILTLNNARMWWRGNEKWVFVTGLLREVGIDYDPRADVVTDYVTIIERQFDRILFAAGE